MRCVECKTEFTLTEGEQQFYSSKGYQYPKRCKPCRVARKAATVPANDIRTEPAPAPKRYARASRYHGNEDSD